MNSVSWRRRIRGGHHLATLICTFKTEYQSPTGDTTEQEIFEKFPAFLMPFSERRAADGKS